MMTASAVVIGGGIVGASIAHYLAAKGLSDVLLLERDTIAEHATGKTGGLIRMHYTNPHDTALALRSREVYTGWEDEIGGDAGFHNTGFLFIVGHDDRARLEQNVRMLQSVGVDTSVIGPEDVLQMQPFFRVDDIGGAAYEAEGGYADGYLAATSMSRRARELGVTVRQDVEATAIEVAGDRVVAVQTAEERIESPIICIASGAWSAKLAETAGVDLPVGATRLFAGALERPAVLSDGHMTVIDRSTGTYFHPDTGSTTMMGLSPADSRQRRPSIELDHDDPAIPEEWLVAGAARMVRRIPAMADAGWRRTWTEVDGLTADGHMVLGETAEVQGLYVAAGMGGSGFKTGPAVGICMAELILDGSASTVDITPFRISRFEEGEEIGDEVVYQSPPPADLWGE
ncbi:MAG TPA: FAD-binding oxidoreductase [Dehalococcoidia bacterium]|jgi:sarcosine oxidase subunit beta|nr:FAD-binding oxidoreductase [Dehalococcoidia bacterium]